MNAKELKEKLINSAFAGESGINYPEGSMGWEVKQTKIRLLDKFIETLCREQREICSKINTNHDYDSGLEVEIAILNAPMPKI